MAWASFACNQRGALSIPLYLFEDLAEPILSRFRLRAHHFCVESCTWLGSSNVCDKCGCYEVQDDTHVIVFWRCVQYTVLKSVICALYCRYVLAAACQCPGLRLRLNPYDRYILGLLSHHHRL